MGRIVLINDVGYIVVEVDGIYLCCVECCVVFLLLEQKIFDVEWIESLIVVVLVLELVVEMMWGSWLVFVDVMVDVLGKVQVKLMVDDFVQQWCLLMWWVYIVDIYDELVVLVVFVEMVGDFEYLLVGVVVFVGGVLS